MTKRKGPPLLEHLAGVRRAAAPHPAHARALEAAEQLGPFCQANLRRLLEAAGVRELGDLPPDLAGTAVRLAGVGKTGRSSE